MEESFVQLIADGLVFPLVILAAATLLLYVPNRRKFSVYSRMLVAGLTSYLVAKLFSLLYQPSAQRPFELLGVEPGASYLDNPGFPSDHALFVWVIVFAIWYGTRKPWVVAVALIIAVLVCVGRVLALVHTPLDIFGGVAAACIGALWYLDEKRAKSADLQKNDQ